MTEQLRAVIKRHPGADIAVALGPVGLDALPPQVVAVGEVPVLVAWSTIKVPLALAATRAGSGSRSDVEAALTVSDNAAAARLWSSLGSGRTAAQATTAILREAGDERTTVPSEVTVAGASPFGQARWRLADQAQVVRSLPCLPGSASVLDPMGRVVQAQRWGLAGLPGAQAKGGWGDTPGGYVVRQMAVVPRTDLGGPASAVAVQVRSGSFDDGAALLDEVAAVIRDHRGDLPAGRC